MTHEIIALSPSQKSPNCKRDLPRMGWSLTLTVCSGHCVTLPWGETVQESKVGQPDIQLVLQHGSGGPAPQAGTAISGTAGKFMASKPSLDKWCSHPFQPALPWARNVGPSFLFFSAPAPIPSGLCPGPIIRVPPGVVSPVMGTHGPPWFSVMGNRVSCPF